MRKLLLFFFALLTSVSGAWAASPAADVYPVAGKQYYLFAIQNDGTRSYLYNNGGTLATSKASVSNTDAYKWTVTVTDGSYKISNVAGSSLCKNGGSLGLGEATSFQLGKDVTYEACVSLWDDTNKWYVAHKASQNMGTGMHVSSFTTNASWSPNFIFEEVNNGISLAAGTLNKSGWAATWTASYNGDITFATAGNNNMTNYTVSSVETGSLDIATGSGKSYNYTLTVPTGKSVRYKIYARAISNDQTITIGNQSVTFTTAGNCIEVSSPSNTSTFTLTGENTGLLIFKFDITLTSTEDLLVTSLGNLSNNKAYVIKNDRAAWKFADDATSMTTETASLNMLDDAYQIAIIQKDGEYYLFSVNANKYLTAENTLTSMPTDNEQVDIVATENASYPWFFRFKNYTDGNSKYTKNINVSSGTIKIDGWGPDGSNASGCLDEGNRNAIIEAADFDATQALEMFDVRTVTYYLSYGGNSTFRTVSDVTVTVGGDPADFLPLSFANPFVSLSYSPATIAAETTEVTVTATWNGPFQISDNYASAVWQVVQMHTYPGYPAEKWSWSYKSDDSDKVKPEQVLEYDAVTTNRLFCFVGNPYEGFKIYNAAAGSGYTLTRSGETDEISMASGDHIFTLHQSAASPDASTYFVLKPSGATNYINYDYNNKKIAGWSDADNGSTCWVVAPGQYYLDFIDGLYLDAPVGAVGTRAYFQTVANAETAKNNIRGYRPTVAGNMYSNELGSLNTYLDPVKATDVITLTNGYYRIVNAYPNWQTNAPTIYYNSANNRIDWSKASNATDNINSIFYIDASAPSIFSPNAQKYMSVINSTVSGSLANEAGTTVFTSLGSAQYNVVVGGGIMHTAGHSSGAGNSGNLTSWEGGVNEASAWYLVKVSSINIALNGPVGGYRYATLCVPFDVTLDEEAAYTLSLNANKDALTLSSASNEIAAGTPVLLRDESSSLTATIGTGYAAAPLTSTSLTGVYVDTQVSGTNYFLGVYSDEIGFYHWGEGTQTLDANRAYFEASKLSDAVKGLSLIWDEETGINSIENGKLKIENEAVYDLSGRRVAKPTKGLYIKNGKKMVIK